MKQELPITIFLLAAGASIWFWNRPTETTMFDATLRTPASLEAGVNNTSQLVKNAVSNASTPTETSSIQLIHPPVRNAQAELSIGDFRSRSSNPNDDNGDEAAKLLAAAFESVQQSPAFQTQVQIQAQLFDQKVIGNGTYYQMGEGRGQSRIDLNFTAGSKKLALRQLCDGRFVYRLSEDASTGKQQLQFYDLQRLQGHRQENRHGTTDLSSDNSRNPMPVASPIEGELFSGVNLPGLLDHLRISFDFLIVPPDDSSDLNRQVQSNRQILRGSWKSATLQRLVGQLFDAETIRSGVAWDKLPQQLPHAVELSLDRQQDGSWFPARICFYRFHSQAGTTMARPTVAINYAGRQLMPDMQPDLFVMNPLKLEAIDITHQYLSRLQAGKTADAASQSDSELRR